QVGSFPQDLRVLTVIGTVTGQPALLGRTRELDLSKAPAELTVAFGPPATFCTVLGALHQTRTGHTATLMRDGRVLIAGGGDPSIELYDPQTATFTGFDRGLFDALAPPATASSTLLPDGRVIIVGLSGAQLVDASGHLEHPALLLRGGERRGQLA